MLVIDNYNYIISIVLMMLGFFGVIASTNLVKKLVALSIFQVSVLLFYISIGYVKNANIPILKDGIALYTNPIPHVLMLTAIVVGVAVMAVGLAIVVRIKEEYGNIEEDKILKLDEQKHKTGRKGKWR